MMGSLSVFMTTIDDSLIKPFAIPVRVYYEDTDVGGVVYYANYLKFMERARTEWLRARGFEQDVLRANEGLIFAVRSATLQYLLPARFNDELAVSAQPTEITRATFTFAQRVCRVDQRALVDIRPNNQVLCEGEIKIACLDADTLRPRRLPEAFLKELTR